MSSQRDCYRAPSWSWASVDGEITLDWDILESTGPERNRTPRITFETAELVGEVERARIYFVTDDPFGQVCGGELYLRGCLWAGTMAQVETRGIKTTRGNTNYGNTEVGPYENVTAASTKRYKSSQAGVDLRFHLCLDIPFIDHKECYFFPLFRTR